MAAAFQCGMCGKYYLASQENVFKHVEVVKDEETGDDKVIECPVNSFRFGCWDQKKKEWHYIASAYDLCPECARKLDDVIFGNDSKVVMKKKESTKMHRKFESIKSDISPEQMGFTSEQVDGDDGK